MDDSVRVETTVSSDRARRRNSVEQKKLEAAVRELFEQGLAFNALLGFRVESLLLDKIEIGFDMRSDMVGHFLYGRLHGGVISSVLDATGGLAVMWAITEHFAADSALQTMQRFAPLGTIDLRIDYLRPGIGDRFVASAEVVRLGRRIASTQMRISNEEDVLIATGAATYIVS